MLPTGINSTRSGGNPRPRETSQFTREAIAERFRDIHFARFCHHHHFFPFRWSGPLIPNATMQPLRIPSTFAREVLNFVRVQISSALMMCLSRGR